jgi:hypothetical protein
LLSSSLSSSLSGVIAGLAQGLPDMVYHVTKRAFAGTIADKPFIVFKFNVIAVDIDSGQAMGAVRGDRRRGRRLSHMTSPRIC